MRTSKPPELGRRARTVEAGEPAGPPQALPHDEHTRAEELCPGSRLRSIPARRRGERRSQQPDAGFLQTGTGGPAPGAARSRSCLPRCRRWISRANSRQSPRTRRTRRRWPSPWLPAVPAPPCARRRWAGRRDESGCPDTARSAARNDPAGRPHPCCLLVRSRAQAPYQRRETAARQNMARGRGCPGPSHPTRGTPGGHDYHSASHEGDPPRRRCALGWPTPSGPASGTGYHLSTTDDPSTAVAGWQEHDPAVVLVDLQVGSRGEWPWCATCALPRRRRRRPATCCCSTATLSTRSACRAAATPGSQAVRRLRPPPPSRPPGGGLRVGHGHRRSGVSLSRGPISWPLGGRSAVWQRAAFGTLRPPVQIRPPRPGKVGAVCRVP